jgi:hypothetical protein
MNYSVSRYNQITEENLQEFKDRKVVFNSTGASTPEAENAILTLQNTVEYYKALEAFKTRLKSSKFMSYAIQDIATLVYKFNQNFLSENQKIKEVDYIYKKVNLSGLIEVALLMTEEILSEQEDTKK